MANYESAAALAGPGPGMAPSGMGNLLQNRLFLSYLSGAGAAMQQGEPIGPTLNAITQQNIAAQSKAKLNEYYRKMMMEALAGGGDIKLNKDKTVINAPSELFGGLGSELGNLKEEANYYTGTGEGATTGAVTRRPTNTYSGTGEGDLRQAMPNFLNPSASPLSGADLAGLTAADVSQALSGAVNAQALMQKSLTDVADTAYKRKQMELIDSQIGAKTPSITIPGTDIKMTTAEYLDWYKTASKDERTAAIKNFEYAQARGFKGSFEEFQNAAKTTHQKNFEQAKTEGYAGSFNEWMLEMAKAGATILDLGETKDKAKASAEGRQEAKLSDPNFIPDIEDRVNKAKYSNPRRAIAEARIKELKEKFNMSPEQARTRAYEEWYRDEITKIIRSQYPGKNVVQKSDGWYVDGVLVKDNPYGK